MALYSRFAGYYERIFPFRDEVFRFLERYAGERGGAVLDAGCGPGHYCGRFAGNGFCAVGVDLDDDMIAAARRKYPVAAFHCLDIRELHSLGKGFRCIYSIGNVMAHLPQEDLPLFLGRLHGMLDQGGYWIMQVVNRDALSGLDRYDFPLRSFSSGEETLFFHRRYDNIGTESLSFSVWLEDGGHNIFEERVRLFPVMSAEYLRLHEAEGFECEGVFSDFRSGALLQEPGSGLVMVFRKPQAS